MMSQRIQKIQHRLPATPLNLHQLPQIREKGSAQAEPRDVALASDIEVLPSAFFVGKRKPISELPRVWRWLARFVYQHTGWASDYGIESQAICTNREMAEALCAQGSNWFVQELPINCPLPDKTCKYKLMTFPGSDAAKLYDHRHTPFVAIPRKEIAELETVERKLDQLHDSLEGKCARVL